MIDETVIDEIKVNKKNPNLRMVGQKIGYTQEQVIELSKCKNDPIYFLEKYVKVVHLDHGIVPFKPLPFQREMINTIIRHDRVLAMYGRQVGKSTTVAALFVWYVIFHNDYSIALLANKEAISKEILDRIKKAYEFIPLWMQHGVRIWNKKSIELENGSKIIAESTSSSAIRGKSFNFLFLDEFAHIKPRSLQNEFWTSTLPTVSSGKTTKVVVVTTKNGRELFAHLWEESKAGKNQFVRLRGNWWEYPNRDEKWREKMIAEIGERRFADEYACEENFGASEYTLIDSDVLECLTSRRPHTKANNLLVYEPYKAGNTYVMTVDVGHGRGLDYTVISVFDVTSLPYKHVAVWRSNAIPPIAIPQYVKKLGVGYGSAFVLVEINDAGFIIPEILKKEYDYYNIFHVECFGRSGQKLTSPMKKGPKINPGLKITMPVKRMGAAALKQLIETNKLLVSDSETIHELHNFISIKDSWGGSNGCHDDIVMTLLSFAWMTTQQFYHSLTNVTMKQIYQDAMQKDLDDEFTGLGFIIDNGNTQKYVNPNPY